VVFRQDIQGLRAIAVLMVLIYHLEFSWLPGGFIGVDVFFVISGYLIAGIIKTEIQENTFSLYTFYIKRLRRLLPALLLVILTCFLISWFLLLPSELETYSLSGLSSIFYVSNLFFLSQSGYFSDSLHLSPLLHTWSLSVEEQFYIFFPFFCLLLHKFKLLNNIKVIAVITLIFCGISLAISAISINTAFFISPARFYQFLTGYLFLLITSKGIFDKYAELCSLSGITLIISCAVLFDKSIDYPGAYSLIPTLGTGLLLLGGISKDNIVSRALITAPMVKIGNYSYSIYLWHWPIIVFFKLYSSPFLYLSAQLKLFGLSILMGYASWVFFENKYRKGPISKPHIISLVGAITILFTFLIGSIGTSGFPMRYSDNSLKIASYMTPPNINTDNRGACFITSSYQATDFNDDLCINVDSKKQNILLLGDSHAAHYYKAMVETLEWASISQANSTGCAPTIAFIGEARCTKLIENIITNYISKGIFDMVVISAKWDVHEVKKLQETIVKIETEGGAKVVILGPMLPYSMPLPRLLTRASMSQIEEEQTMRLPHVRALDDALREQTTAVHGHYISLLDILCNKHICKTKLGVSTPLLWDKSHFTEEGALFMVSKIEPLLKSSFNSGVN
jgi:peptidoglycan/LPS O-acetylase OafA/YrhL